MNRLKGLIDPFHPCQAKWLYSLRADFERLLALQFLVKARLNDPVMQWIVKQCKILTHQRTASASKEAEEGYWSVQGIQSRRSARRWRRLVNITALVLVFFSWAHLGGARELALWIHSESNAREALAALRASSKLIQYFEWAKNLPVDRLENLQNLPAEISGPLYHPEAVLHPLEREWIREMDGNPPWQRICIHLVDPPMSARKLTGEGSQKLLVVEMTWQTSRQISHQALSTLIKFR